MSASWFFIAMLPATCLGAYVIGTWFSRRWLTPYLAPRRDTEVNIECPNCHRMITRVMAAAGELRVQCVCGTEAFIKVDWDQTIPPARGTVWPCPETIPPPPPRPSWVLRTQQPPVWIAFEPGLVPSPKGGEDVYVSSAPAGLATNVIPPYDTFIRIGVVDDASEYETRGGCYVNVVPDCTYGIRDPLAPCGEFRPGFPKGSCIGDGHHLCRECSRFDPREHAQDPCDRCNGTGIRHLGGGLSCSCKCGSSEEDHGPDTSEQ